MSEIRTRRTLLGASFPGRRIASLERFVPSPPSKVPAEDEGGGLLFGLFIAPSRVPKSVGGSTPIHKGRSGSH